MALDYSLAKVRDYESLWESHPEEGWRLQWRTKALVFATMTVGLETITTRNIPEWERRLGMLRAAGYPSPGWFGGEPWWPTEADLLRHVGLRTNASRRDRREFNAGVAEYVSRYGVPAAK